MCQVNHVSLSNGFVFAKRAGFQSQILANSLISSCFWCDTMEKNRRRQAYEEGEQWRLYCGAAAASARLFDGKRHESPSCAPQRNGKVIRGGRDFR